MDRREKMSSNKFFEGIPVLPTRFATWAPWGSPPEEGTTFLCFSLSFLWLLTAPFSSPHSYHYFRCRVRYTRSKVHVVVDRQEGTHKNEPDFQHLLQSRKTAVWNDFSLAKALHARLLVCDSFLYSIESSKSTGAYVFELFSTGGRPNDRLTPHFVHRWHDEF